MDSRISETCQLKFASPGKNPLCCFPFKCREYMGMLARYTYEEQGAFMRIVATYIMEDGQIDCYSLEAEYRLFSAVTESEQTSMNIVFDEAVALAKTIIDTQKNQKRIPKGKE